LLKAGYDELEEMEEMEFEDEDEEDDEVYLGTSQFIEEPSAFALMMDNEEDNDDQGEDDFDMW